MTDINKEIEQKAIADGNKYGFDYDSSQYIANAFKRGMIAGIELDNKWIPVRERLPDENKVIICSVEPFDFNDTILMKMESDFEIGVLTSFYTHWRYIE